MDFECAPEFYREPGSMTCKHKFDNNPEAKLVWEVEFKAKQCAESGFYESITGYRKVPGDICFGGQDLSPSVYKCDGAATWIMTLFKIGLVCCVLYFGWPMIEVLILMTPLPDPAAMKEGCTDWAEKFTTCFKDLLGGLSSGAKPAEAGYAQNFEQAPMNMDEEDDDEEDVGRDVSNEIGKELSYDSDEAEPSSESKMENEDLINLGDSNSNAKQVPKLRKPRK
jgi:hypothetical protein